MPSTPDHKRFVSTLRVDCDTIILEFLLQLRSEGTSESYLSHYPGSVRHFLTWLDLNGISIEAIDGAVIEYFLQHDCDCCSGVPAGARSLWSNSD